MSELRHYGVLGMKWGVRRYQPYGKGGYDPKKKGKFLGNPKKAERRLNKMEAENARQRDSLDVATKKADKAYKKLTNRKRDEDEVKLKPKYEDWIDKKAKFQKNVDDGQKEIQHMIDDLYEAGYDVTYIQQSKYVRTGAAVAGALIGGSMGALLGAGVGSLPGAAAGAGMGSLVGVPSAKLASRISSSTTGNRYDSKRYNVERASRKAQTTADRELRKRKNR